LLVIRLARIGAKKKPVYRVVVMEKSHATGGAFLEIVGEYNPRSKPAKIQLANDRIQHWIGNGAKPSATVARLMKAQPAPAPPAAPAAPTPEQVA
jgi:small subunit ribosomal protein S16